MGIIRNINTKEDYLHLLLTFYSFFAAMEHQLQNFISAEQLPDWKNRRKAAFLAADIEALGGVLPALAPLHKLPAIHSAEDAMGALYVLEGSTLGGQVIAKLIAGKLKSDLGRSYFEGYGQETMAYWQRFLRVLNLPEFLPGYGIVFTAAETFQKLGEWLTLNYKVD